MRLAVLGFAIPAVASAAGSRASSPPSADQPTVVGGLPAEAGKWRDAAGIHLDGDLLPDCTGVVIAPTLVLTARHCLDDQTVIGVLLGATRLDDSSGDTVDVAASYVHPSLDVGVIVLAQPASIQPRVIASSCVVEEHLENGARVAIVGFGLIDENGTLLTDTLREATTTVTDFDCSFQVGCSEPGSQLSAGGEGVDSCLGDSGGPLYLLTEHYDYLIGTTWSGIPGQSTPCGEGGLYVRSDAIVDWVEDVTDVSIPRANCNTPPRPKSGVLLATPGEVGKVTLDVADDEGGELSFRVVSPPAHGEAGVTEDGVAFYRSSSGSAVEDDTFEIAVTDDGVPALTGIVSVEVREGEGGCGCRSGQRRSQAPLASLVLGLLLWILRRRTRQRRTWT